MTRAKATLIVDSVLLALFGTDAWKTKESEPRDRLRRQPKHYAPRHDPPRTIRPDRDRIGLQGAVRRSARYIPAPEVTAAVQARDQWH
jgi:hypothetical protein